MGCQKYAIIVAVVIIIRRSGRSAIPIVSVFIWSVSAFARV